MYKKMTENVLGVNSECAILWILAAYFKRTCTLTGGKVMCGLSWSIVVQTFEI